MKIETQFTFESANFKPTAGELDEKHDDYINPGVFAKEAASFIAAGLVEHGHRVKDNFCEDWGRWVEVENPDGYFLAVGVANFELEGLRNDKSTGHRAFVEPNKSPITKFFFKKIDTEARVKKLVADLKAILEAEPSISNVTFGEW